MAVVDPGDRLTEVLPSMRQAFQRLAREFENETGLDLKIRSGRRTCAEQNDLYASGRTQPGDIVTYAPGCRSWHVLGLAIDADPVGESGCAIYTVAGEIWEEIGGAWGGRFPGFGSCGDAGHFEWHPEAKISEVCEDPNECAEAVALAAEMFPARVSFAKIAGGMLFVGGLVTAGYLLFRH